MITIEWIALNGKSNGICKQSKYLECENQKYDAQWHRIESCCVFTSICFGFIWIFLFYFIFQFALKFNSFHWNERIRVRARPQPMPLIRPTVQISTHSHINKPNWINQFFSMRLLFGCSAARVRQRERGVNDVVHSLQFSSWRWLTMTMGNDEMPQAKNFHSLPLPRIFSTFLAVCDVSLYHVYI